MKQNLLIALGVLFAIFLIMNFGQKGEKEAVNNAQYSSIDQQDTNQTTSAPGPASSSNLATKNSAWKIHESVDAMTDSRVITASTKATAPIKAWLKSPVPTLFLRCANNKTEAFISTGTRAQPELGNYNQATITIRFDDKKPFNALTTESTDGEALFVPKAISFGKQALSSELILIKFVPFNSEPAIASFQGGKGDEEAIKAVRTACGW